MHLLVLSPVQLVGGCSIDGSTATHLELVQTGAVLAFSRFRCVSTIDEEEMAQEFR